MKLKTNTLYAMVFPEAYLTSKYYYISLFGGEEDDAVLCLGEITNMPEHYIMVGKNGIVRYGLHADLFRELDIDEV